MDFDVNFEMYSYKSSQHVKLAHESLFTALKKLTANVLESFIKSVLDGDYFF